MISRVDLDTIAEVFLGKVDGVQIHIAGGDWLDERSCASNRSFGFVQSQLLYIRKKDLMISIMSSRKLSCMIFAVRITQETSGR